MTATLWEVRPGEGESLLDEVSRRSGQKLSACYQCRRCAAGCPVGEETDFVTPDRLIRLVTLGDRAQALGNPLVWKCVSCYTCGTRCPNNIQTARITETLKQMSKEARVAPLLPRVKEFHDAFLGSAVRWGRVNEVEFMMVYELKNTVHDVVHGDLKAPFEELLKQTRFALPMLKKKRMHLGVQGSLRGRRELGKLWRKAKAKG